MSRDSSGSSILSDTRFVSALGRGDMLVFEQLYRAWFQDLAKYASTFVSDEDAKDVVQDVFLSMWKSRSRVKVPTDQELFYYLLRSVRNRSISISRRDRSREHHHQAADLPEISVDASADTDDLFARVEALIQSLPPRSREVLILRWYHVLDFEHIASIMGISYGSAHVLHSRALAMVRKALGVS